MAGSKNKKVLSQAAIKKEAAKYAKSTAKDRWQKLTKKYGMATASKIKAQSERMGSTSSKSQSKSRKAKSQKSSSGSKLPTGGIFSVLQPQYTYEAGQGTAANRIYAGIMEQSASNYNRLAKPPRS